MNGDEAPHASGTRCAVVSHMITRPVPPDRDARERRCSCQRARRDPSAANRCGLLCREICRSAIRPRNRMRHSDRVSVPAVCMPTAYDRVTGWNFDYGDVAGRPPPGGLTLTNIQHWGHNFCKELRLIGIRIGMEEVAPDGRVLRLTTHFLPLSDPPFQVDHQQLLEPHVVSTTTIVGDITRFNTYFTGGAFVLRGDYVLGSPFVGNTWPNCEFERMIISQRFAFSPYNASPRHEPSGGLLAARCHPMTRFHFHPNPAIDR